jgi:hypothetical protein
MGVAVDEKRLGARIRGAFAMCPGDSIRAERRALAHLPAAERHHVVRRVQDAFDLRSEGLECFALLPAELVLVVDAPNAPNDVSEAPLGMIGGHTCKAHERPRSAAQIVDHQFASQSGTSAPSG